MPANSTLKAAAAAVSVVIPCYRCGATIARAVASVLAQTLPVAEIILVDDASGDDTLAALEDIRRGHGDAAVRVLAAPANVGAGEARNLGWNAASQPWVAFLDADDAWHPRKIEIQYGWLLQHPQQRKALVRASHENGTHQSYQSHYRCSRYQNT